jgi:hypothetical protein
MAVHGWLLPGCFSDLKRIACLLYSTPGFHSHMIGTVLGLWYVLHAYIGQENLAKYPPQEVWLGELAHQYTGGSARRLGAAK